MTAITLLPSTIASGWRYYRLRRSQRDLHFTQWANLSIPAFAPQLVHALAGGVGREPDLGLGLTVRDARLIRRRRFRMAQ